jgi:branched-chain amino acid transport system permease protein
MRSLRLNRIVPISIILLIAYLIPVIQLPPYIMHVFILVIMWAYLSTAWNILGGTAGQLSLGHAAFFGIGAYTTYFLTVWFGLPPLTNLLVSGLTASLLSVVIGYPCFRYGLRGAYFTLATIAFAEIMKDLFIYLRDLTGGSLGVWMPILPEGLTTLYFFGKEAYYYVMTTLYVVLVIIIGVMGRFREYLVAIREDEDVSASIGINVTRYKLLALMISSFFVGVGGAYYICYFRYINPYTAFGLDTSLQMALISIFGGMYSFWGPLIGSIILTPIGEYLRITLGGTYVGSHLLIYGLLLILIIRFLPKGIYSLLESIYGRYLVRGG